MSTFVVECEGGCCPLFICLLMIDKEKIVDIATQWLEASDAVLVGVKCSATNVVEVLIDSLVGVQIDKCIELSRHIESHFDREVEDFELTVASYSVSDPFVHQVQFQKNVGRQVEIIMSVGGAKVKGEFVEFDDESVSIKYEKKVEVEGKKRKQLMEFTDKISRSEIKTIKLSW